MRWFVNLKRASKLSIGFGIAMTLTLAFGVFSPVLLARSNQSTPPTANSQAIAGVGTTAFATAVLGAALGALLGIALVELVGRGLQQIGPAKFGKAWRAAHDLLSRAQRRVYWKSIGERTIARQRTDRGGKQKSAVIRIETSQESQAVLRGFSARSARATDSPSA